MADYVLRVHKIRPLPRVCALQNVDAVEVARVVQKVVSWQRHVVERVHRLEVGLQEAALTLERVRRDQVRDVYAVHDHLLELLGDVLELHCGAVETQLLLIFRHRQ